MGMATNTHGDPGRQPRRPPRYARLRASMGRRPTDLVRIAMAAAVVLVCLLIATAQGVNPVESAIFTELERLPRWSAHAWQVLTWAGSWPGVALAAGLALYAGRVRLGASLLCAGVTAWLLVLLVQALSATRPLPTDVVTTALRGPGQGGFDFPSVHSAVVAALATAAGPYLVRTLRDTSWVLVFLVAVADVFRGTHLPVGVLAGVALGWGTGTLFHLVLGAPGRRTSEQAMRVALEDVGLHCDRITAVHHRWWQPYEFDLLTSDGTRLRMKVVRRMHRLAGPAYRLGKLLAAVEFEHAPRLSTPVHEVEHEAYLTLLAERAGVGTLPIVVAGRIEHGPPFLVSRQVEGHRLSTLPRDAVDEELLGRIWAAVMMLGEQHMSHHDLRAQHILVDTLGRPRITDFTFSRVGAPAGEAPQDIADLLVTLASVVGVERAVESAVRELPQEQLARALPHLQWLSLHRRLRRQLAGDEVALADLRETLAERIGCAPPSFRSPVRPVTLAILGAVGLAVYLLLPQLSSLDEVLDSVRAADWRWIGVAVATGLLGVLASGVTILGSSPAPLPVAKTMAVQLAAAFTGRTTAAGVGFYGVNIIYLERLGLRRSRAVGVIVLNRAAVGVVTAVLTAIGILIIGNAVPLGQVSVPTGWPVLGTAALILVAAIALLLAPVGRRRVWRPAALMLRELAHDLLPTLRRPIRALQLVGGSVAFLLLQAVGLAATLEALHPGLPLVPVLAVYVVGSTLGQLVPTPGGLGAVEAATVAGLTAVGVDPTNAVAAVLASRALTFWFPALAGLVAFRFLQHHDVI